MKFHVGLYINNTQVETIISSLNQLFFNHFKQQPSNITELPQSGSYRRYFRLSANDSHAIGVYNADIKENEAFFSFTNTFLAENINVPEIFCINEDRNCYLLSDLGDSTLFHIIENERKEDDFSNQLVDLYKNIIRDLPIIQIKGGNRIDYSKCYPRDEFDQQSMMWDLNYFKYYFLKLAKISFDEQKLEDDFKLFCNYLLDTPRNYFLFRDFQSRNIMILDGKPWYIDYQGGRKGALQYDIASLLYDAKAAIPNQIRTRLLDYYIDELSKHIDVNKEEFTSKYYGYVLIRIMQAMGAYGFRGFYEKKEHFLKSIPYAIDNLHWILNHINIPVELPTLMDALRQITQNSELKNIGLKKLSVQINSFSFKRGIPVDESGNGGGFIFDCRSLHNPGKYDEYKTLTGMDQEVIDFLKKEDEVGHFLHHTWSLIDSSVKKYQKRGFTNLMVNFGCTGGQHRSVFCAEQTARHLKENFDIDVELRHREQEMKGKL